MSAGCIPRLANTARDPDFGLHLADPELFDDDGRADCPLCRGDGEDDFGEPCRSCDGSGER